MSIETAEQEVKKAVNWSAKNNQYNNIAGGQDHKDFLMSMATDYSEAGVDQYDRQIFEFWGMTGKGNFWKVFLYFEE